MGSRFDEVRIFSGNGNPALAEAVCRRIGVPIGDATVTRFENENIFVRLHETVRDKDVFVIQSLCSPLSDNIMEFLIFLDACKRSSAGRLTAVLPYYAYGRTDKKDHPRVPITARLLADMIEAAGADSLITFDLHAGQIQGFFNIPVDELSCLSLLARHFANQDLSDAVVVSPDLGFVKPARNFAEMLGSVPLVIAEKRRLPKLQNAAVQNSAPTILNLIGDVEGKRCIIVDDEIATGKSVLEVTEVLFERGAKEVCVGCVHPVFVGEAIQRLRSNGIREVVTTDTLPIAPEDRWPGLKIISVGTLLGEVIQRIHSGLSVDTIFQHRNHLALI